MCGLVSPSSVDVCISVGSMNLSLNTTQAPLRNSSGGCSKPLISHPIQIP